MTNRVAYDLYNLVDLTVNVTKYFFLYSKTEWDNERPIVLKGVKKESFTWKQKTSVGVSTAQTGDTKLSPNIFRM
jgi:hypothetical protein